MYLKNVLCSYDTPNMCVCMHAHMLTVQICLFSGPTLEVDAKRGFYVLNPSSDLPSTEVGIHVCLCVYTHMHLCVCLCVYCCVLSTYSKTIEFMILSLTDYVFVCLLAATMGGRIRAPTHPKIHTHTHTHIHTHTHTNTHTYTHTHTHTHIHTRL